MFCPKCGKKIADGVSFCPECGARIAAAQETTPGADTQYSQAQVASSQIAKKKRSKKPLVALLVVLVVAAGAFAGWWFLFRGDTVIAEDDTSGNEPGVEAYEDFTVGEVTYADGGAGPRLEFTVTNNTDETIVDANFSVKGEYAITDEYGDKGTTSGDLDLICWTPGGGTAIAYLEPGENDVVLIPDNTAGVVAMFGTEQGDVQDIDLDEVENIEVEVSGGQDLDSNVEILTPRECDLELSLNPDGTVNGTLTNNTEDRWRKVTVYARLLDSDGGPCAPLSWGSNRDAFYSWLDAEYVKPGADADLSGNLPRDVEPSKIEAMYIVVDKDV